MNKFVFGDGRAVECLFVEEGPEYYDGANRRALSVQLAKGSQSLDALDAILADESILDEVRHVNEDNGAQDIFNHYSIRMGLSVKAVPVGTDEDGAVQTEERIEFRLGRLTPIEIKLKALGL